MNIVIRTLGCKSNRYESDKLVESLRKSGVDFRIFEFGENVVPDVLVVNTCTVTQVADRKSRQVIFGLKKANPACKVVVFGCGSNVSPDEYKKLSGVNFVAKNSEEVLKIVKNLAKNIPKINCEYETRGEAPLSRTRALIKIQDGCNNYCTYCIVPRARGPEVSYSSKKILEEAKLREAQGYKEIVLTGINIGEWKERGKNIADLIELLIKNTKSVRFRVSSIEPKNFSEKFYKLFKTERLCPHMHMSLQSGSDSVLKRMHRNYSTKEFLEICEKFKKAVPDIGLTTDVIIGFPGETEKEFEETCKFVKKIGFLKIHVFPYSKRENTAAYYMGNQIPENVKKIRAEKLRKIADDLALKFKKSLLGKTYEILVENPRGKIYRGFTPNYVSVQFLYTGKEAIVRDFAKVKLEKIDRDGTVHGKLEKYI